MATPFLSKSGSLVPAGSGTVGTKATSGSPVPVARREPGTRPKSGQGTRGGTGILPSTARQAKAEASSLTSRPTPPGWAPPSPLPPANQIVQAKLARSRRAGGSPPPPARVARPRIPAQLDRPVFATRRLATRRTRLPARPGASWKGVGLDRT